MECCFFHLSPQLFISLDIVKYFSCRKHRDESYFFIQFGKYRLWLQFSLFTLIQLLLGLDCWGFSYIISFTFLFYCLFFFGITDMHIYTLYIIFNSSLIFFFLINILHSSFHPPFSSPLFPIKKSVTNHIVANHFLFCCF